MISSGRRGQLLLGAWETVAAAANVGGGRLVVDAIDERAHGLHAHDAFTPITGGGQSFLRVIPWLGMDGGNATDSDSNRRLS